MIASVVFGSFQCKFIFSGRSNSLWLVAFSVNSAFIAVTFVVILRFQSKFVLSAFLISARLYLGTFSKSWFSLPVTLVLFLLVQGKIIFFCRLMWMLLCAFSVNSFTPVRSLLLRVFRLNSFLRNGLIGWYWVLSM